jgi:hypothetical protein
MEEEVLTRERDFGSTPPVMIFVPRHWHVHHS